MAILNSYEADECCGDIISKWLRNGWLEYEDTWICPVCGIEWTPHNMGGIQHWVPRSTVIIVR
jgi:hypothetical protein